MIKANYVHYRLHFKKPAGTSRGVLKYKDSWFILAENVKENFIAVGECSLIPGLSPDNENKIEDILKAVCDKINEKQEILTEIAPIEYPSVRFGLEMLKLDYLAKGSKILFNNDFSKIGIPILINGLIWMGDVEDMLLEAYNKINSGFTCLKLKIGTLDFESELSLIKNLRTKFPADVVELRLDANGAFLSSDEALNKLEKLSAYSIHSIEQPVKPGNIGEMAAICRNSPIPVALDEELIGIRGIAKMETLIKSINPQFIILKPSLLGGIKATQNWIDIAKSNNTAYWVTSALESNIGLNAIAQWTFSLSLTLPQGLGTGQLFINNIPSPLKTEYGGIFYDKKKDWVLEKLTSLKND